MSFLGGLEQLLGLAHPQTHADLGTAQGVARAQQQLQQLPQHQQVPPMAQHITGDRAVAPPLHQILNQLPQTSSPYQGFGDITTNTPDGQIPVRWGVDQPMPHPYNFNGAVQMAPARPNPNYLPPHFSI